MTTPKQIINDLGGSTRVAAAADVGVTTVSEWKRSGSIPVRYWPALIGIARSQGKQLDEAFLVRAHVPVPTATQGGTRICRETGKRLPRSAA